MLITDNKKSELSKQFKFILEAYLKKHHASKQSVADAMGMSAPYLTMFYNQMQWPRIPTKFWELIDSIMNSGLSLTEWIKEHGIPHGQQTKMKIVPKPKPKGRKPKAKSPALADIMGEVQKAISKITKDIKIDIDLTVKVNGKEVQV